MESRSSQHGSGEAAERSKVPTQDQLHIWLLLPGLLCSPSASSLEKP